MILYNITIQRQTINLRIFIGDPYVPGALYLQYCLEHINVMRNPYKIAFNRSCRCSLLYVVALLQSFNDFKIYTTNINASKLLVLERLQAQP